jgi:hypothetical protein
MVASCNRFIRSSADKPRVASRKSTSFFVRDAEDGEEVIIFSIRLNGNGGVLGGQSSNAILIICDLYRVWLLPVAETKNANEIPFN